MMNHQLVNRRAFLGVSVTAAAVALAGCSSAGNTPTASRPSIDKLSWPVHVSFKGPKPDLAGTPTGVNPGYFRYPPKEDLVRTVAKAPGDGKPVTAMTTMWGAAKPPLAKNSFWQYLNSQLGSKFDVQRVPGTDYPNVFATTVAGGSLPDLFTVAMVAKLPQLLETSAVDLGPHLAGDAIKAYSNLANFPQDAWKYAVYNGKLFGIPIYRGLLSAVGLHARADLVAQLGLEHKPTSIEDFHNWVVELNDPSRQRWTLGAMPYEYLRQCFGIANDWSVDTSGKFTSAWEAIDRQEAFLEAGIKLVKAGTIHPDGFSGKVLRDQFYSGQVLMIRNSLAGWLGYWAQFALADPSKVSKFKVSALETFNANSTAKGAPWRPQLVPLIAAIGKGAANRVETILGVANMLAAPLGSVEALAVQYGQEGKTFKFVDGVPQNTERGNNEIFGLADLAAAPFFSLSIYRSAVEGLHSAESYLDKAAIASPAEGLYSETQQSEGASLVAPLTNITDEILRGRQPVSAFAPAVKTFLADGGNKMREEYEKAYAATH